jgi:hypothetical protein
VIYFNESVVTIVECCVLGVRFKCRNYVDLKYGGFDVLSFLYVNNENCVM